VALVSNPAAALPARPRLADHVLVRRHYVDRDGSGALVETIVLHDPRTLELLRVSPRILALLLQADGTRDLDGIALAGARAGALHRHTEVRAMLEELHARGLLVDGIDGPVMTLDGERTPEDRPIRALPGFALVCDGSGTCCRQYSSIAFTPDEAARAQRLVVSPRDGAIPRDRVFLPLAGAVPPGPKQCSLAVSMVDGACAYLNGDGRCAIHAAGGPEAKPRPCAIYPATFVDDGASVRVSIKVECVCVMNSVGMGIDAPGAAPLVEPSTKLRRALDETVQVRTLPTTIPVTRAGATMSRAEYVAWSDALVTKLDEAGAADDVARACWSAACALDPSMDDARLSRLAAAFRTRAVAAADSADEWRGKADVARIGRRRVAEAAQRLVDHLATNATALPPMANRDREAFYLRAALFGHHLVGEGAPPLADAACDRVVRLLVARVMGSLDALPLVEAMTRGHGLDRYVEDRGETEE
jgi:lysine-N-methylase